MKPWLAAVLAAWVCIGCAQGNTSASRNDGSSITMYGVIDQGVSLRK